MTIEPRHRRRRAAALAAAAVIAVVAAGCDGEGEVEVQPTQTDEVVVPPTDRPLSPGEDRTGRPRFNIELVDNAYQPSEITVPAGEDVTLLLENTGDNGHTFTAPALDLDVELQFGSQSRVDIVVPKKAGEYEFRCRFHAAQGMRGTIIVEE